MEHIMKFRVLLFDSNDTVRSVLWQFIDSLGYEVFTFTDLSLCPVGKNGSYDCPLSHACSDIILAHEDLREKERIEFLKDSKKRGCKVNNIVILSEGHNEREIETLIKIGCQVIMKPFEFNVLKDWLKSCEKKIKENRVLSSWYMNGLDQSLAN
jgi:response regulator of citrate/malate metabolism